MAFKLINPEALGAPHGYSNGVLTQAGGRLLFIAGQLGWDRQQKLVSADFVEQFDRALANVITIVEDAGGRPDQIARLIMYVTDRVQYLEHTRQVGERYRDRMGKHFPAMVLVEVKGLLDYNAKVEIEGIAVLDS
jgi:enamine deaminase RidA (YjgF/YER057c/UK114 family)